MRHDQAREYLFAYIEQSLDPAMRTAVERHIHECDECHREWVTLRALHAMLDNPALEVEPPGTLHDNVMRRVRLMERERSRTPQGFLARLGWGWTAAAATAATAMVLALVVAVGPLHDGFTAGVPFLQPEPAQVTVPNAAPEMAGSVPALTVAADGQPIVSQQENRLRFDVNLRTGGTWRLISYPTPGVEVLNATPSGEGVPGVVWEGKVPAGTQTALPLLLRPSAPGSVMEIAVRLHNAGTGEIIDRTVFVPVQTGGQMDAVEDWPGRSNDTLRAVLTDVARTYGQPVCAPRGALDRPVSVNLRGADAPAAVQAAAAAAGLRYSLDGNAVNLYP